MTAKASTSDSPQSQAKKRQLTVHFGRIHAQNLENLRVLNCTIFPVRYNEGFYADILKTRPEYSMFAYLDGIIVGAICCRLEPLEENPRHYRVYIMTLGVLHAYRHYRIGSQLLNKVIDQCRKDRIESIYLHVQISNEEALAFYDRFGFQVIETIENYYKRIDPPHCYLLSKKLSTG